MRDDCYPKMRNSMSFTMVETNWELPIGGRIMTPPLPITAITASRPGNGGGLSGDCAALYLYVVDREKKKKPSQKTNEKKKPKKERYLLCKKCENKISKPDYRIEFQGAFEHTFLNPAGQVFRIGCFTKADGCIVLGDASSEWSWFQGFQWRIAVCGQCLNHLGWFYISDSESSFFGLILDALV